MFALWCLVKAPLMLGSDLRTITRESAAYRTITNPGLLAVNQDKLGVQVGPVVEVVGVEGGGSRLAQGECVKDCCSHGPTGGLTSPQTCLYFAHSWQVTLTSHPHHTLSIYAKPPSTPPGVGRAPGARLLGRGHSQQVRWWWWSWRWWWWSCMRGWW